LADFGRELIVRKLQRVAPARRDGAVPVRDVIRSPRPIVNRDLESLAIVILDERQKKKRYRVLPQQRRNIPDAELPVGRAIVAMRSDGKILALGPGEMFAINPLRIVIRVKIDQVE